MHGPGDDELTNLVDGARGREAALSRSRERWLRRQAEEEASLRGTLVDLAETGLTVSLRTISGRAHVGTVTAVARDFCVLRTAGGLVVHLVLDALAMVRPEPGSRTVAATGDRPPPVDLCLAEVLSDAAATRPRAAVVARGIDQPVAGELRAAGLDVLSLRLDGEPGGMCYLALESVTEVALFDSG